MKLSFGIILINILIAGSCFSNDFLDKLRSGEIKRNYVPGVKKDTSNFLEDLRSGKIKRNYPQKQPKADPDFLNKLRSGEISRDYNKSNGKNSGGAATTYGSGNGPDQNGNGYNKRGKVFIDDISVDHMLKNKESFSKDDIERIKAENERRLEKEKFLQRIRNN